MVLIISPTSTYPMILVDSLAPIGSTKLAGLGDDPEQIAMFRNAGEPAKSIHLRKCMDKNFVT